MMRRRIDFDAVRCELGGRCFVCELLAGNPEFAHRVVYEDEQAIAVLQQLSDAVRLRARGSEGAP
jgi:hypothetical protein